MTPNGNEPHQDDLRLQALDHLVLTVQDIAVTVQFYRDVLGMRPVVFNRDCVALAFGRCKLKLHRAGRELEPRAISPSPGSADLCLVSEAPIERVLSRLRRLSVAVIEGPVARAGAVGEIRCVYVRDPDGNLVEIAAYQSVCARRSDLTIISGGQTGVDRGALEAALSASVPCGGWCPLNRMAEDGRIPDRFPLRELTAGYTARTRRNVEDSDGTVILYFGELEGGTEKTLAFCMEVSRPYRLVDAREVHMHHAAGLIDEFVEARQIRRLNVAGPRASKQPRAYDYSRRALGMMLAGWTV